MFYLTVGFYALQNVFLVLLLLHFSRKEQSSFTVCVSTALMGFWLWKQMKGGANGTHFTVF